MLETCVWYSWKADDILLFPICVGIDTHNQSWEEDHIQRFSLIYPWIQYICMNVDDLFWLYLYQRASILFHASLATTKVIIYTKGTNTSSSTFLLCLLHAVSIPHLLAHSFDKKFPSFQTFTLCYAIWALLLPLLDLLFSPELVQI